MKLAPFVVLAACCLGPRAQAQSWVDIGPSEPMQRLAVDPTDADHLVAFTNDGWRETTDGGGTWTVLSMPSLPSGSLTYDCVIDAQGRLYAVGQATSQAATQAQLCMERTPSGWQPFGPAVPIDAFDTKAAARVTRGALDPDLVVVEVLQPYDFGVGTIFLSDDGGATWSDAGTVNQGTHALHIVETAGAPYIVRFDDASDYANSRLYVQRSSGWSKPDQVLWAAFDVGLVFGFTPRFADDLWAVEGGPFPPGELWRSADAGANWAAVPTANFIPRQLLAHPRRPGCLVRNGLDLSVSTDGGVSWTPLTEPSSPIRRNVTLADEGRQLLVWNPNFAGIHRAELLPESGTSECSAQPNASGAAARIQSLGAPSLALNDVSLIATDVAPSQFGMFITSRTAGFVPGPGGSFGDLCLGGIIGRMNGTLQNSGAYGQLTAEIDLGALPSMGTTVAAQVGDTWRFQAWFRDVQSGQAGSNFSDAVAITVVP